MNKFLISTIVITFIAFLSLISQIDCEKQISKRYTLRKFGLKFEDLAELQFAETFHQKINLELEKQEKTLRIDQIMNEVAKRRRIFEKYLLKFQRGSSVLRDFHANLF